LPVAQATKKNNTSGLSPTSKNPRHSRAWEAWKSRAMDGLLPRVFESLKQALYIHIPMVTLSPGLTAGRQI